MKNTITIIVGAVSAFVVSGVVMNRVLTRIFHSLLKSDLLFLLRVASAKSGLSSLLLEDYKKVKDSLSSSTFKDLYEDNEYKSSLF